MTRYHLCKKHRNKLITIATLTTSCCLAWADYGFHYHGLGTSSPELRICTESVETQKNWCGYSADALELECEESDIWYQCFLETAWRSAYCYKSWEQFTDHEGFHRLSLAQVTNVKKMFDLSLTLKP